jgi:hypothetical protein
MGGRISGVMRNLSFVPLQQEFGVPKIMSRSNCLTWENCA